MKEEHRKKIKEIIGDMKCPKNFICVEAGFTNLCKAKDFGLERYLECLEEYPGGVGLLYDSRMDTYVNVRCECMWPRS